MCIRKEVLTSMEMSCDAKKTQYIMLKMKILLFAVKHWSNLYRGVSISIPTAVSLWNGKTKVKVLSLFKNVSLKWHKW